MPTAILAGLLSGEETSVVIKLDGLPLSASSSTMSLRIAGATMRQLEICSDNNEPTGKREVNPDVRSWWGRALTHHPHHASSKRAYRAKRQEETEYEGCRKNGWQQTSTKVQDGSNHRFKYLMHGVADLPGVAVEALLSCLEIQMITVII